MTGYRGAIVEAIASVLAYVTIIECRPAGRAPPLFADRREGRGQEGSDRRVGATTPRDALDDAREPLVRAFSGSPFR